MKMANSFGNQNQSGPPANGSFSYNGNYQNNRNSVPPVRNPLASPWFRYNPSAKAVWTAEEDAVVEECVVKYASDSNVGRYAKICKRVQNKSVREVAVRCKIHMKKQNDKRRKVDRVSKGRKGKVNHPSASSSHLAGQPALNANRVVTSDNANGTSYSAIGGATGQLLQQNEQAFEQISANLKANKFHENVALLSQARDNILKILTNLNETQEVVEFNRMPPFPVVMNEELIKVILPPRMNANHTNNL